MPDVFADLRRVGALKRGLLDGQPSSRRLAELAKVSHGTPGTWLAGSQLPQQLDPLLKVVRAIRAEAVARGLLDARADALGEETVAELLDEDRWRVAFDAERKSRNDRSKRDTERGRARAAQDRDEFRARRAALADRPRPVRKWSAARLGVHPAIPGKPSAAAPGPAGFVLPAYVERRHDTDLHSHLATAVVEGAAPTLVVVEGPSCTGKTRTCHHALERVVPDYFNLLFPADAASLLAVLNADALDPNTVLWLNEAQQFLDDGPHGEAVAAALLRRLDGDGPLIVMATLWPEHDAMLTSAARSDGQDPHRQVRAMLAQAHRFYVPRTFTDDLDAARDASGGDASLAGALETGSPELTQILAAGPDLVRHYEHPSGPYSPYGKAVLSAAMDACRLGVTSPLPLTFLEAAAPGYLTPTERADVDIHWFEHALAHTQQLIKHTARPLHGIAPPMGMGRLPGVVGLADFLQHHGRHTRRRLCPPVTFWNAALDHLTNPGDLCKLAEEAQTRFRLSHAAQLYCAAFEAGDAGGVIGLAHLRRKSGDHEGAEQLLRRVSDGYNAYVSTTYGIVVHLTSNVGDPEGLAHVAEQYRERARQEGKEEERVSQTADVGDGDTAGWMEPSLDWMSNYLEEGHPLRVAEGDTVTLAFMVLALSRASRAQEAEELLLQAAERESSAPGLLATMLDQFGHREEALGVLLRAADPRVLPQLAQRLEADGRHQEAEQAFHSAADSGVLRHLTDLARLRDESNDDHLRYGLDAAGALAEPWSWPQPKAPDR
ncbi:tetratricopeptide repeat protein [Streptomyces sp. NPDC002073]